MRKAQAAMEFLMTYGWAILVVLVAIGALAYFGVLSPDNLLPRKCTLEQGIACKEHKVTSGTVTVVLENGMGYDLTGVVASVEGCGSSASQSLNNGDRATIAITCASNTTSSKFAGDINVTYTLPSDAGGLSHINKGTIRTKVE